MTAVMVLADDNPLAPSEVNAAFWQACHGGFRRTAECLLARGADVNWIPDYAKQTPLEIAAAGADTGRMVIIANMSTQPLVSADLEDSGWSLGRVEKYIIR